MQRRAEVADPGWRPSTQPRGEPALKPGRPGQTYTSTSLVAPTFTPDSHWDVKHNITARGFQAAAVPAPTSVDSVSGPAPGPPGFKSISAPVTRPGPAPVRPQLPGCEECGQQLRGVFLQSGGECGQPEQNCSCTAGRPICTECFVCSECRVSLKNVGHSRCGKRLRCTDCGGAGQQSEPGPAAGLAASLARVARPPGPAGWHQKLDLDQAGAATNAEDFTAAFMKQLSGVQ